METAILKPETAALTRPAQTETSAMVLAAQAKALVQAKFELAMLRPRDMDMARSKLLKECKRPGFCETARYSVPRGNKFNEETKKWEKNYVRGFSIRYAEAAVRCITNIDINATAIYDDREKRILRCTVTDLESNVTYSQDVTLQKTVERRKTKESDVVISSRLNSSGETVFLIEATDDELLNKQNALISKTLRTLELRHIPGDILDESEAEILKTQRNQDAQDPDAAKKKLIDAFSTVNVTVQMIKDYLGHDLEGLSPKELDNLRGIYAAMKEGELSWSDLDQKVTEEKGAEPEKQKQPAGRTAQVMDILEKKTAPKMPQAPQEAKPATQPPPEAEKPQEEAKAPQQEAIPETQPAPETKPAPEVKPDQVIEVTVDTLNPRVDLEHLEEGHRLGTNVRIAKILDKKTRSGNKPGSTYGIASMQTAKGQVINVYCYNTKMLETLHREAGKMIEFVYSTKPDKEDPEFDCYTFEAFVSVEGKSTDVYGNVVG